MTNKLTDITTTKELAVLLEVDYQRHLIYHLYRVSDNEKYLKFEIPKRSGGTRAISAPATHLKTIQRRLADKLEEIYIPQNPAHGFRRNRSIITNAEKHVNRNYVLNVDLVDFFGTINFGRVMGMFMAHPYYIPKKLATVLAQICCHDNALPQGAPTSPIVSNMLCSKMDSDLRKLARRYYCRYTRYADDITISTNQKKFPRDIAYMHDEPGYRGVIIGDILKSVITRNGFEINTSKSRLQTRFDRQEVTGLVTNKKLNVNRRFIRNTRAMIYSWATENIANATELHYKKNNSHSIADFKTQPDIEKIIRGRLEFIRAVRGLNFNAYKTLAKKYNELKPAFVNKLPIPEDKFVEKLNDNVFVIQNSPRFYGSGRMGTAFYLEDIG